MCDTCEGCQHLYIESFTGICDKMGVISNEQNTCQYYEMEDIMRGGKREGAGRPTKPENEKAQRYTFRLYQGEVEKVREFIKSLRSKHLNLRKII